MIGFVVCLFCIIFTENGAEMNQEWSLTGSGSGPELDIFIIFEGFPDIKSFR